jgi:hypothetical protein
MAVQQKRENHLIAALSPAESQRWLPQIELVEMPLGAVLYEPGVTLSHVYFPATSIVSLLYVLENGASAEIPSANYANVRNRGMQPQDEPF